ncbi:MAG: hypothetical protein JNL26_00785, partial [Gemmatimonadetes bacterium]|nr:hypothetical protein [Gemmatimonadota bacterium]
PVIHRMAGPGMLHASGSLPLNGRDRAALLRGQLRVGLFVDGAQADAPVALGATP